MLLKDGILNSIQYNAQREPALYVCGCVTPRSPSPMESIPNTIIMRFFVMSRDPIRTVDDPRRQHSATAAALTPACHRAILRSGTLDEVSRAIIPFRSVFDCVKTGYLGSRAIIPFRSVFDCVKWMSDDNLPCRKRKTPGLFIPFRSAADAAAVADVRGILLRQGRLPRCPV